MKRVLVLGCTGSIGTNALNIIKNMPESFRVCGVQAHSNQEKLNQISQNFSCPSLL